MRYKKIVILMYLIFATACGSDPSSAPTFKSQSLANEPTPYCQPVYGPWLARLVDAPTSMRIFGVNSPTILVTTSRNACELLSSTTQVEFRVATPNAPAQLDASAQLIFLGTGETFRLEIL